MKIKKVIFPIIAFILLVLTIQGALAIDYEDSDNFIYLSLDNANLSGSNPLDLTPNNNDGINSGAVTGATGKIDEAFTFTNDKVTISNTMNTTELSINIWLKTSASMTSENGFFGNWNGGGTTVSGRAMAGYPGKADNVLQCIAGGNVIVIGQGTTLLNDNVFHMLTCVYTGTNVLTYVDGVLEDNDTYSARTFNTSADFLIGSAWASGQYLSNGVLDEGSVWTKSLNQDDIDYLYNSNSPTSLQQYPFTPPSTSPFTVKVKSIWNNSFYNDFKVSILPDFNFYPAINGTYTSIYNNSQGLEKDIAIISSNVSFFQKSFANYNISTDLVAETFETDITFNFRFRDGSLADFGPINIDDLTDGNSFSTSNGILNIFPNAKNITLEISCNNNIFQPFNYTREYTSLQNITINITLNETLNELIFLDINDSSAIENATITIYYPSGEELETNTNENGSILFSWIYNNITELGNYTFNINKNGYINQNFTETLNSSNVPFIKTYNISRAKLTINIYDRETNTLLSGIPIEIAMIDVFNETTSTGTLFKDNLSVISGEYIIYAGNSDYKTEIRVFDFTNQEELTLNFYLLNLSSSGVGNLFVSTLDSFFRKQTGAKVELLEYSPDDLSFISVSDCITNINAECSFSIQLNTKIYYLRATTIIGDSVFIAESNPEGEIITTNNEIRQLIFYTRTDFIVDSVNNLVYDIDETFLNNISSISVDFFTIDGTALDVCIEYFKKEGTSYTSVTGDTYCLESSSAIQNIDAIVNLNRSNDYEARVYIKQPTENRELQTFIYPSKTSTENIFSDEFKSMIVMIFWILLLAFSLHAKNINFFLWGGIILSWGELLIFPTYTIASISVFKTIICLATLFVARRKKDLT